MASYQLELMDHEVNMISLNENQSIIIEKNGYRIITDTQSEDAAIEETLMEEILMEETLVKEKVE
jgi:hypothetical protein